MSVQGQYGEQFLYTIEVDGQRDKLYATPMLHQQLQAAGVGPGEILTITKIEGEGNRKSWVVQSNGGNGSPPVSAPVSSSAASDASGQTPASLGAAVPDTPEHALASPLVATSAQAATNGREPSNRPDFESLKQLMVRCLRASWQAWQGLDDETGCTSTDVRKVGISLFMECARKGIVLQEEVDEDIPF